MKKNEYSQHTYILAVFANYTILPPHLQIHGLIMSCRHPIPTADSNLLPAESRKQRVRAGRPITQISPRG